MKTCNKRQFLHRELLRRLLVVVTMTALDFSRAAEVLWACEPTTSQASCITPCRGMARLSSTYHITGLMYYTSQRDGQAEFS